MPRLFADRPAFNGRHLHCIYTVGLMQGILFNLAYKDLTIFLSATLFAIVAFFS